MTTRSQKNVVHNAEEPLPLVMVKTGRGQMIRPQKEPDSIFSVGNRFGTFLVR